MPFASCLSFHPPIVSPGTASRKAILDIVVLSGYHASMRKGIDYIGVGAGAIIVNAQGKLFLAKRGTGARNERHKWEFPGGSVEFGEQLADALIREIREEYGFDITVERLLDVVDHIIPHERQHWVSPTFLCRVARGAPRIREPHKCDEIGWFDLDRIPVAELTIASRKSLESYQRHILRGSRPPRYVP